MSVFATIVKDAQAFKAEVIKLASQVPGVAEKVSEYTPEVEALVALAYPAAAPIEASLTAVLTAVEAVVTASGSAASANGVDAVQDKGVIAAVEAVIAAIKKV